LRQPAAYYEAAWKLRDPSALEPNRNAKYYKELVDDSGAGVEPIPLALPQHAPVPLRDLFDDGIGAAEVAEGEALEEVAAAAAAEAAEGEEALVEAAEVAAVAAEREALVEVAGGGAAAAEAAEEEALVEVADAGGIGAADVPPAAVAAVAAEFVVPDSIEGRRIVRDQYSGFRPGAAQRTEYIRLRVTCPCHAGCDTSRVINDHTTRKHGLREVVAYLGVWISSAGKFTHKASHKKERPTQAEMDAYVAAFLP